MISYLAATHIKHACADTGSAARRQAYLQEEAALGFWGKDSDAAQDLCQKGRYLAPSLLRGRKLGTTTTGPI